VAENTGRVVQVIGNVVDVVFDGALPRVHNALRLRDDRGLSSETTDIVLEVQQHLGENRVRTVAMQPTDGVVRGLSAVDSGAPISVPVGEGTLGRVMNVLGEPVDEAGEIEAEARRPLHRQAPEFVSQSTSLEMFETGIKVIDLLEPYMRGGKVGLFGGAGVGKTVIIMELINNITSDITGEAVPYPDVSSS